jgi:hypothetical protein
VNKRHFQRLFFISLEVPSMYKKSVHEDRRGDL